MDRLTVGIRVYVLNGDGTIDLSRPVNINGGLANPLYSYDNIPDINLYETNIPMHMRQIVVAWLSGTGEVYEAKMEFIRNHFYVIESREEAATLGLENEFDRINEPEREIDGCPIVCPGDIEVYSATICNGESIDLYDLVYSSISDYSLIILDPMNNIVEDSIVSPTTNTTYRIRAVGNPDVYGGICQSNVESLTIVVNKPLVLRWDRSVSQMNIGSTATFQVTIDSRIFNNSGTNEWLWSSSDENIATVSQTGFVTAIAVGTIIISFEYTNNNGCTGYIELELTVGDCTPSLELSEEEMTVCINTNTNILDLITTDCEVFDITITDITDPDNPRRISGNIVTSAVEGCFTYNVEINCKGCRNNKQIVICYQTPPPIWLCVPDELQIIET